MSDSNFLINVSVLYRNVQKYLDKELAKFDIGSGQIMFLFFINENEGVTMQEVTRIVQVDKGTTTKSIQKLIEQDYIQARTDENDRRVKRLYTTPRAAEVMNALYECRNHLRLLLSRDMEFELFESLLDRACENTRSELGEGNDLAPIRLGGMIRTTLKDYPGKLACTVLTAGCGFKCPYCRNRDLVFLPENFRYLEEGDVFSYLEKRKGLLDGVVISGGEPLLHEDLLSFIERIKALGYKVKIDTNGNHPAMLAKVTGSGLADYIAMDIKNCREKYAATVGLNPEVFRLENIEESIRILKESDTPYEFRTTVVREFHTEEDLVRIAEWIGEGSRYFLRQYEPSDNTIQSGWTAYDSREMQQMLEAVRKIIPDAQLKENGGQDVQSTEA